MKKIHIIGILLIAISIAVIFSTVSESSTYVTFSEAQINKGKTYHVIGKVNLDVPFIYNPENNANVFGFSMIDSTGVEMKILYNGSKPQDFERSEKIVVVGKVVDANFIASQVLMKCPSKYNGTKNDQSQRLSEN